MLILASSKIFISRGIMYQQLLNTSSFTFLEKSGLSNRVATKQTSCFASFWPSTNGQVTLAIYSTIAIAWTIV